MSLSWHYFHAVSVLTSAHRSRAFFDSGIGLESGKGGLETSRGIGLFRADERNDADRPVSHLRPRCKGRNLIDDDVRFRLIDRLAPSATPVRYVNADQGGSSRSSACGTRSGSIFSG
jgi:hypothetical protein